MRFYGRHMERALKTVETLAAHLDVLIEVRDARAPRATEAKVTLRTLQSKPRLVVLGRADLAREQVTRTWLAALPGAMAANLKEIPSYQLAGALQRVAGKKRPRAAVIGLPNVGKSSLINRLAGRYKAVAANKPGVTRAPQWLDAQGLDLLDVPGIVPPAGDTPILALLGLLPEGLVDPAELFSLLVSLIGEGPLAGRYGIEARQGAPLLAALAKAQGLLGPGGAADEERAAKRAVKDFQSGRLGRFTLEAP